MLELKNLGKKLSKYFGKKLSEIIRKLSKYFGKKLSEINQKFGCAQNS